MEPLDRERVRGSSPQSWGCRGRVVGGLPVLIAALAAASNVPAQDPPETTQPATTAPATAPASAPAKPPGAELPELVLQIAGQSDAKTRRDAAVAIITRGADEGVKALLPIFDTQNNEAAKAAVCEAIAEVQSQETAFVKPLLTLLEHKDARLREAALAALAGYADPAIVARIKTLKEKQEHEDLIESHRAIMRLLYEATAEAKRVALLQTWLASPLTVERETALDIIYQTLKKTKPPDGILQQIRTMLGDPDESVRRKLVEVLRDSRQLEDARLLEARLRQEKSVAVRELIYHALGYIRDPKSIPVCVEGLKDPVDGVAARAARALGELAEVIESASTPEELKPAVEGLVQRASKGVAADGLRESVIDAMASIADPQFLDVLTKHAAAEEPVPAIRQAALRGIGRIGEPAQTATGLVIARLAAEQDAAIREAAAEALGKIGSQLEHLKPLRDRLTKAEPSAVVQKKAWEAYRLIFTKLAPADQEQVIDTSPAEAIRLAADAQLPQEVREAVGNRLLDAAAKTGQSDPKAALSFLDELAKAVPPEQLGAAWAARLVEVRRTLQAATQPATAPAAG